MSELSLSPSDGPPSIEQPHDALLFLALECEHVLAGSERWSLHGTDQVLLGRGDVRRAQRRQRTLTVSVPDPRMSTEHARLIRIGGRWLLEDRGSKNGTIVNGRALLRAELADRALIEVGRTLFLFRELPLSSSPSEDLTRRAVEKAKRALRTFSTDATRVFAELFELASGSGPVLVVAERGIGVEALARAVHDQLAKREPFAILAASSPDWAPPSHGTLVVRDLETASAERQRAIARSANGRLRVLCTEDRELSGLTLASELGAALGSRSVVLPPLRARPEDLGLLIGASLKSANAGFDWAIEPEAARALFGHGWPDNQSELDAMLRSAAAVSEDGLIRLEHLPEALRAAPGMTPEDPPLPPTSEPAPGLRDELCAVLIEHGGNVSAAARSLGRDRSSLRRELQRLCIDAGVFRRAMDKKKPSDVR